MRSKNSIRVRRRRRRNNNRITQRFEKIMRCLCSAEQLKADETENYSTSVRSSRDGGEVEKRLETGNIEEAESSLRESSGLNYEEARALLGRYEYQKGNLEAALHVFEGIDITSVTPKMENTLSKWVEPRKRRSHSKASPPMSIHAVSLLLEAFFLKAKSLQALGRYEEAARSCKIILDIVESSLPSGLPETLISDSKLHETLNNAVELLPELYKLAESPDNAISSYRRALLNHFNLDAQIIAKIQKEFAIFLLYSGFESSTPPNLRFQFDTSFVPKNNTEEAILLLMILLRKVNLGRIKGDPSILDHLSYGLSIIGGLKDLASQFEELLPGIIDRSERYYKLALCYHGEGDDFSSLNLLRKLLNNREEPTFVPGLLMASKICGSNSNYEKEGVEFAKRAIKNLPKKCDEMAGVANYLLGVSLSACSRSTISDSDRFSKQNEALRSFEIAAKTTRFNDPKIVYGLSLENAEQRKLDVAVYYAKRLIRMEGGSNLRGWILLCRILSAQKRFSDAEIVIEAALEQTGKWDRGELLREKATLLRFQRKYRRAIDTYSRLLGILRVESKSFGYRDKICNRRVEFKIWNDLALVYIELARWGDAETCLSKSEAIDPYSSSTWHTKGLLHEAKGNYKEALGAFAYALDIYPTHVASLISMAVVLRRLGSKSSAIVRSFLMEALLLDRMNASAWFNLGLLYKDDGIGSVFEAAECFETATFLEETEPVTPFR